MREGMKKKTVVLTCIIMLAIAGLVGLYAFLTDRAHKNASTPTLSTVQLVLARDLQNNYPASVKEVVKYYTELQKCFYNEEYTEEELDALGMKARELFDDELLAANEVGVYLQQLRADISSYKTNKRRMTSAMVGASTSVFYFEEDGFKWARIHCGYTITEKLFNNTVGIMYLLRQDDNKQWKIYGWENVEKLNSSD